MTTIDFGPNVFTGTTLWLQIGVRTNGFTGAYTSLSPRQQVTPTPCSIFAEGANAANLTGTIPSSDLSGVDGSGLINLNATQLTSGTVQAARLPGDVAYTDANQAFVGSNTFVGPGESFIVNSGPIVTTPFNGLGLQYYVSSGEGAIMSSYNDGYGFLSFYTKQAAGYPLQQVARFDRWGGLRLDQQGYNNGTLDDNTTNGVGLSFGINSGEGIASKRTCGRQPVWPGFLHRLCGPACRSTLIRN